MIFADKQKGRIYLTGFMGTGKTTTGRKLAEVLGLKYLDTDSLIVEQEGRSIEEIFSKSGEEYFRKVEQEVLHKTFLMDNVLISTGGGLPVYFDNLKEMKENGICISLTATPDEIIKRVENSGEVRPLLQCDDRMERIKSLMGQRAYYYVTSHILVDTTGKSTEEIVEEIILRAGLSR